MSIMQGVGRGAARSRAPLQESARGAGRGQATASALLLAVALLASGAPSALAQLAAPVTVGSDEEHVLRSLQLIGVVPLGPWSIRGFSAAQLDRYRDRSAAHPWSGRAEFLQRDLSARHAPSWTVLPVQLDAWYNSSYAFGINDGAVWRGKGMTTSLQGGAAARWRWFSAALHPQLTWSQNAYFHMMPVAADVPSEYGHQFSGSVIDLPQRFGPGAVGRLHPGQSFARVDALGVTAGVSTANQFWGPMSDFPYILGNNAPGFAHVFAGSSTPWNAGVGRIHGRIMYGRLAQSAYSPMRGDSALRMAAGLVGTFTPRGAEGLELGIARFFHTGWPGRNVTMEDVRLPFRAFLKLKRSVAGDTTEIGRGGDPQNQLASVFFRWAFPRSGVEAYGEYGREDHNINTDDLRMEPDHAASYGLGVRKAGLVGGTLVTGRAELINYQRSTLQHHRAQGGIYIHFQLRQGHTHMGQMLGSGLSPAAGAGALVAFDTFGEETGWGVQWMRLALLEAVGSTEGRRPRLSVQHAVGVEHRRPFRGLEVGAGLTGVYEFNRYFSGNAPNLQLSGSVRWGDRQEAR